MMSNLYKSFDQAILKMNKKVKFVSENVKNNEDLNAAITSSHNIHVLINKNGFDNIYNWYFRLNSISKLLNDVFNKYLIIVLIFSIPTVCFSLFYLMDFKNNCKVSFIELLMQGSFIIIVLFFFLTVFLLSANINHMVYKN